MSAKAPSLARLAEWCVERSGWARRQPAFAYFWGQLISSRLEAELKAGASPDPRDFARLARALSPVFSSRDEQLKRGAWLSLHCALAELIGAGEPDRLAPQARALLNAWPELAPPPDAQGGPAARPETPFQNSFFCRALYRGHLLCAQDMSERKMPWTLPDETGALSAQLPSAILAEAQAELAQGAAGEKNARAKALLMSAFSQGADSRTPMSQHRGLSPVPGFPGFTQAGSQPLTLGALAASLGCSDLFERCRSESLSVREREALDGLLKSPEPSARRGPSL